jgi:colicin import membrane protein
VKSIRVAFILSLGIHVVFIGVSSFFAHKAKMQPSFYAVTLLQGTSETYRGHRHRKDVTGRKVERKIRHHVRKGEPKTPKKVVDSKPKTIKEMTSSSKEKEKVKNSKVKSKKAVSDYEDVQNAIAQIYQKEVLKSVEESVAEIRKELLEEKERAEEENAEEKAANLNQESEDATDERVSSPFQGSDSQEGELYRTQLWSLIHSQWSISESNLDRSKDWEVRIVMRLSKDGSILDVKIVQSSGDLMFDNSALLAIKKVGQFPPFPPEIALESEEFEVSFVPQEN